MKSPWLKFYPSDWRSDPALRMCSLAARGLWMEMLCLMHESTPRGSLLVNGLPVDERQLAALCGVSVRDVSRCMGELERAGVFSREDNGTVFSRRIRRDQEKAERDKANGRAGGNPRLKQGVNPPDKAQKLEARNQKEEEAADAASSAGSKYAFEQGVIRLTPKDFAKWKAAFEHIDLAAELIALAPWAAEQREWFHAVSGALAKRNREVRIRADAARASPDGRKPAPRRGAVQLASEGHIEGII